MIAALEKIKDKAEKHAELYASSGYDPRGKRAKSLLDALAKKYSSDVLYLYEGLVKRAAPYAFEQISTYF